MTKKSPPNLRVKLMTKKGFAKINNTTIVNPDLKDDEYRFLTWLLGKSNCNWSYSKYGAAKELKWSVSKVDKCKKALKKKGYWIESGNNEYSYAYSVRESLDDEFFCLPKSAPLQSAPPKLPPCKSDPHNNTKLNKTKINNNNINNQSIKESDKLLIEKQNEVIDEVESKIENKKDFTGDILDKLLAVNVEMSIAKIDSWILKLKLDPDKINKIIDEWIDKVFSNKKIFDKFTKPPDKVLANAIVYENGRIPEWIQELIKTIKPDNKYEKLFNIFAPEGLEGNDEPLLLESILTSMYLAKHNSDSIQGRKANKQIDAIKKNNLNDLVIELNQMDISAIKNNQSIKNSIIDKQKIINLDTLNLVIS